MTFSAYIQNLGVLAIQWIPVAACFYVAVRLGVQHGIKAFVTERATIAAATSTKKIPVKLQLSDDDQESLDRR